MIALSKAVTDEEIQIAATYFAALKPRANIGVVETGNVGQISVANWMLAENKSGAKEAIDQRIIELPENPKHVERRDSHPKFVVLVPVGRLKKRVNVGDWQITRQGCRLRHLSRTGFGSDGRDTLHFRTLTEMCASPAL